jgi:hypothetical protein
MGSGDTDPSVLNLGTRWRIVNFEHPAALPPGTQLPVHFAQEAEWVPEPL